MYKLSGYIHDTQVNSKYKIVNKVIIEFIKKILKIN